jgi:hypothetical protein
MALAIVEGRPSERPSDETLDDDPSKREWQRAILGAVALGRSPTACSSWDALSAVLQGDLPFAEDLIRTAGRATLGGDLFGCLNPERLADLYLWGKANLSLPKTTPRGVHTPDPIQDFVDRVLNRLTEAATHEAAEALDRIARETDGPWARMAAERVRGRVREAAWRPLTLGELEELLQDPRRRPITTPAQLADAIEEAFKELQAELTRDAAARRPLWDRQVRDGKETAAWRPLSELEVSDHLRIDLRRRLRQRAFVDREVEIQPRIGKQPGQRTDLVVSVSGPELADPVRVIVEVKCSWNDEVETALDSQLARDYLRGAEGRTGIYLVVEFGGDAWDDRDRRKGKSRAYGRRRDRIEAALRKAVDIAKKEGLDVRLCFLLVELERESLGETSLRADEG